jgi:ABC-type multidrug transport system fused ATPase/permease subunit
MDKFIQMDIFFFISSLIAFFVLFFVIVIGLYIFLIVRKINKLTKITKEFTAHLSQKGRETTDSMSQAFQSILKETGVIHKIVKAVFAVLLTKIFHATIKKEARKKKED